MSYDTTFKKQKVQEDDNESLSVSNNHLLCLFITIFQNPLLSTEFKNHC